MTWLEFFAAIIPWVSIFMCVSVVGGHAENIFGRKDATLFTKDGHLLSVKELAAEVERGLKEASK